MKEYIENSAKKMAKEKAGLEQAPLGYVPMSKLKKSSTGKVPDVRKMYYKEVKNKTSEQRFNEALPTKPLVILI